MPGWWRLRIRRNCLFHCGGAVRRGDRQDDTAMTIGWHGEGGAPWRVAVGGSLPSPPPILPRSADLYRDIADRLLAEARRLPNGIA